jgi:hypothetical protein
MSARYEFKVGPANRNSDYADPVTVYADTYSEALNKAITFRGYRLGDGKAWLIRIEELPPSTDKEPLYVQPD